MRIQLLGSAFAWEARKEKSVICRHESEKHTLDSVNQSLIPCVTAAIPEYSPVSCGTPSYHECQHQNITAYEIRPPNWEKTSNPLIPFEFELTGTPANYQQETDASNAKDALANSKTWKCRY
jgi:hypothetical protein